MCGCAGPPNALPVDFIQTRTPLLLLDAARSLELNAKLEAGARETESVASAEPRSDPSAATQVASAETPARRPAPAQQVGLSPIPVVVVLALACAALVGILWRSKRRRLGVAVAATGTALLIPVTMLWLFRHPGAAVQAVSAPISASVAASAPVAASATATSSVAPNQGPPYKHPKEATLVIAHGLIADALVGAFATAEQELGDETIRAEIGFPTTNLTAGMLYAVDHYEQDGWGRPFRLIHRQSSMRISSAGADGVFDTADDIVVDLRRAQPKAWDWAEKKHAFFVHALAEETVLFYHREPGKVLHRIRLAQELTGQSLFDVLLDSDFPSGALARLLSAVPEPPGNSLVLAVLQVKHRYSY